MKKVALVMVFFFAVGVITVSAQATTKAKKQFSWTKIYMDEIGINEDVQAKIEAVKKENNAEIKAVNESAALSTEEKKAKLKALHLKRHDGIYALLTKEQKKKAAEIVAHIKKEKEESGQ